MAEPYSPRPGSPEARSKLMGELGDHPFQFITEPLGKVSDWWLESGMGLLNPNNPAYQAMKYAEDWEKNNPNMPPGLLLDDPAYMSLMEQGSGQTVDPSSMGLGGVLKKAIKKPVKEAVGLLFDDVDDYSQAMKMAEKGQHLKRDKTGQYVGAPKDPTGKGLTVSSPQALSKMRKQVDEQVAEGASNADWYDRARRAYAEVAGGDPTMGSHLSRGGAAYSPQATPMMETENIIRQHAAKVIKGEDIIPRTGSQSRNVAKAYQEDPALGGYLISPEKIRLGKKPGPYGEAKDPTIPDESLYKTASDIWHGRVFGYTSPGGKTFKRGFTPQEHGFLTGENLLASKRATEGGVPVGDTGLPMTPRRMQAATWGAARFRQFKEEAQERIENAIKKRKEWDKDKRPATPKKDGGKGSKPSIPKMPTDEQILQKSLGGIDQSIPRLSANETFEYVTGESIGHLKGLNKLPKEVRQEYSERMQEAFGGDRDLIYEAMQMYQRPSLQTQGVYVNSLGEVEFNPGYTARPLTGLIPSDLGVTASGKPRRGGPMMDPASREAIDTANTVRSILTAQESGGWNKFTPSTGSMKAFEKTGGRFEGTPEVLVDIQKSFEDAGLNTVNVGDALHIGRFDGDMDGSAIQKIAKKVTKDFEGKYTAGRWETGYNPTEFSTPGSGTATRQLVGQLEGGVKDLGLRMDKRTRMSDALKKWNAIDREFSQRYNLPMRNDLLKLRELISSQTGFEGLPAHVAKYGAQGLPALLPLGLLGLDQEQ